MNVVFNLIVFQAIEVPMPQDTQLGNRTQVEPNNWEAVLQFWPDGTTSCRSEMNYLCF